MVHLKIKMPSQYPAAPSLVTSCPPSTKLLAVRGSFPGSFVKPTTNSAINKMCNVLEKPECKSFGKKQWKYVTNSHHDIPAKENGYDCGVFICLYARCMVRKRSMINQSNIPDFRKHISLSFTKRN